MGEMAMLRQEFLKAQHYKQVQDAYAHKPAREAPSGKEEKPAAPPAHDLKSEAMLAALEGRIPVIAHAERVSDMENALRLADEFHLHLILADAAAAWRIADQLAARKIPVIIGPILEAPGRMESVDVRLDNAARLYKAGVPIAIQTSADNEVRNLTFEVEYAVSYGLPEDAALAAVTLNPAQFFGVDGRLGQH
jgi:imidazolonepropionase-like amidohydrolase